MKTALIILVLQMVVMVYIVCSLYSRPKNVRSYDRNLLNMANTVSPIITQISENLCGYENMQLKIDDGLPAKGGQLIYKREITPEGLGMSCVSGMGNFYYIRCYEWGYEDDRLWYRPTHDVPLECYSCIDEKDVLIPYWDKKLQNAELGVKYYPAG